MKKTKPESKDGLKDVVKQLKEKVAALIKELNKQSPREASKRSVTYDFTIPTSSDMGGIGKTGAFDDLIDWAHKHKMTYSINYMELPKIVFKLIWD